MCMQPNRIYQTGMVLCAHSSMALTTAIMGRKNTYCKLTVSRNPVLCPTIIIFWYEGSLEVKLPTIWTDEKQRWEESEKRREEERRSKKRKSQKKEDPGARKGRKVAKHCVFPMIWGSGGSKSRLASGGCGAIWPDERWKKLHAVVARSTFPGQSVQNTRFGPLLEVAMSKKCTPLWREAHFEVKMYKAHQGWTTFGSWDIEKVHVVVARSTFRSQNVQNTPGSDHFWKLRCRKSARRCGAKHMSKSNCWKHNMLGPFFDVQMSLRVAGARDCAPCQKWAKRGFCSISNNNGRRGTFEEDLQRCIFRGRRSTRDIFMRGVRRSGGWFPEFAEMILRDRCSTSYDLASLFRGRRSTFDRWSGN